MARDPRVGSRGAYAQFAQLRKINKFVREQNVGYVGFVGFLTLPTRARGKGGPLRVRARVRSPPNHTWEAGCKNRQKRQKRHSNRARLSGFAIEELRQSWAGCVSREKD